MNRLPSDVQTFSGNPPRPEYLWQCRNRQIELGSRTCLMGILNVTPDSFSDGGRYTEPAIALERAEQMVADGADILDIGGESTRPGAPAVAEDEERDRVVPLIRAIRERMDIPLSVDTRKASVAGAALEAGADIVNDVSAGEADAGMFEVVRNHHAGMVLMHMRGTPETMQDNPVYDNVVRSVDEYLADRRDAAIAAGIPPTALVVDPGIGFGKTTEHNVELLAAVSRLHGSGLPVLIGMSRKRFLGELTGRDVDERVIPGIAAMVLAITSGVHIARVHDVAASRDAAVIADRVMEEMTRCNG